MAKRRRLTPANPMFFEGDPAAPGPVSPPIANVVAEASATAALAEMSESMAQARSQGRMVVPIPLDQIDLDYLMRDRMPVEDGDMQALIESLRARGQRVPVEVTPPDAVGRYGLISGWRRCKALARLLDETGDERFGAVLALTRQPDQSRDAYVSMIEENEIRAGLSFYERARIVARTVDSGVYASPSEALGALFASASKAKRSKIRSFMAIVKALDGQLRFPQAMGERQGLELARVLGEKRDFAARLAASLSRDAPETVEAEQALIKRALTSVSGKQAIKAPPLPLAPGLEMQLGHNRLTVSGTALTPEMQARLAALLRREFGKG